MFEGSPPKLADVQPPRKRKWLNASEAGVNRHSGAGLGVELVVWAPANLNLEPTADRPSLPSLSSAHWIIGTLGVAVTRPAMANLTSPFCSSPSTSIPSPSSPLSTTRGWRYPGPSTKFTRREKEQTLHTRWKSSYTPVSPVLSTERRAHRRTQSSTHTDAATTSTPATSTSSEYARSPLSRFSSYVKTHQYATMAALPTPVTPGKQMDTSRIDQDSPFSDYFTDDARSVIHDAPASETQQILVRLHKLQAYLMRSNDDTEREALNILGRKMGEIDLELNALHSQTRPLLEDSGVFMDNDDSDDDDEDDEEEGKREEEEGAGQDTPEAGARDIEGLDSALELPEPKITSAQKRAELDFQLVEAQRVLAQVSTAQEQLRQRHAELRELNDMHILRIEDREQEIEVLRSENETLKSDLGFDHSELLFLKLQFKALEVEVDTTDNSEQRSQEQCSRRNQIAEEMKRWHSDWSHVDGRFRRRRSAHRVLSADHRDHILEQELEAQSDDEDGEWRLETIKQGHGKVQSITIRRLPDREQETPTLDGTADDRNDEEEDQSHSATQSVMPFDTADQIDLKTRYVDQSTQTDNIFSRPSSLITSSDIEPFPVYQDAFLSGESDEDECAITTSSTTRQNSPVIRGMEKFDWEEVSQRPERTAWQELWEGLANVAGGSYLDD